MARVPERRRKEVAVGQVVPGGLGAGGGRQGESGDQGNAATETGGENVRPWLQAFSLGKPDYTAEHITQQKQAVYDAGYDGWVLWHPGSKFEPFESALERGELVSRKKAQPTAAPKRVN